MASVDITNWDEKNVGSVGNLSDSSSFTGLQKVQPVKITEGTGSGTGDAQFSSSTWDNISSNDDIVVTESDESTTRPYEIESLDTSNNVAWVWVYGSWDSDDSDQIVIGAGTGDGTDYSQGGTGANPWGQTGINAELVQHGNEENADETTGTLVDSSPNSRDMTLDGGTDVDGQLNGAISYDGTDDTASGSFQINSVPFTVAVWINYDNFPSSGADYINTSGFEFSNDNGFGIRLQSDDNNPEFLWGDEGHSGTGTALSTGTWEQLGFSADSSNNLTIYQNADNTENLSRTSIGTGSAPTSIAAWDDGSGPVDYSDAKVDIVRYFDGEKSANWWQADYDASPKGGQTFFSWSGATATAVDKTVSVPQTTGTGSTPNLQVNAGDVIVNLPVTQDAGSTLNPSVFTDLFLSAPVSTGNSVSPSPQVLPGNKNVFVSVTTGTGTTPNPAVTLGETIRALTSTGTGSTPNPSVKGGVITLSVPKSSGTGTTPEPELLFDQVISARVSTGNAVNPEPVLFGEDFTVSVPVSTGTSEDLQVNVFTVITPRDDSLDVGIDREQDNILSGDIDK